MKNIRPFFNVVCLVSGLCLNTMAQADDWGCEVLLCLSNPQGPMAVSQCVPPIRKLWRELARGHGFPTCLMSNSQNQYAKHEWASASNCPPGALSYDQNNQEYYCRKSGVVSVIVDGVVQTRTWWGGEDVEPEVGGNQSSDPGDRLLQ